MFTKITRILLITLIVGLCIAVVYLNTEQVSVAYGPGSKITAMGGIVYLAIFALGLLCSLYLWVVYGVKVYIRERSFKSKEEKQKQFYNSFLTARSLQSTGEYVRASEMWRKLIKKDPTDIIARVELSRTLEQSGDPKAALKVLDKAREVDPTNVEVLLQAAHLNERLGNNTAALDNLALALYQEPNVYAAGKARSLSVQLGRIEDALEYQRQYESVGGDLSDEASIELQFLAAKEELNERSAEDEDANTSGKLATYRKFVKRHPHYLPAILELVELELGLGNTAEAAEILLKAAKENHAPSLWKKAIDLWLEKDDAERALSAARTALRNASSKHDRYVAHLDLARVNLLTGKPEQALAGLKEVSELEHSDNTKLKKEYLALTGYSLNQQECYRDAEKIWRRLLEIGESHDDLLMIGYEPSQNGDVYFPALREEVNS